MAGTDTCICGGIPPAACHSSHSMTGTNKTGMAGSSAAGATVRDGIVLRRWATRAGIEAHSDRMLGDTEHSNIASGISGCEGRCERSESSVMCWIVSELAEAAGTGAEKA